MLTESPTAKSTSSTITETVIEKLHQLPLEQQQEVLDFVEFLVHKSMPQQTIWEKIEARIAQVPPELWEELPTDGAKQHDHYLYGTPKRQN